jgi:hypothetical protein
MTLLRLLALLVFAGAAAAQPAGKPPAGLTPDQLEDYCRAEEARKMAEVNRRYHGRRLLDAEAAKAHQERLRVQAGFRDCVKPRR